MNKENIIRALAEIDRNSALIKAELNVKEEIPDPTPMPVGGRYFNFNQEKNHMPFPDKPSGNGYVKCSLPSHPIVSMPVHEHNVNGGIAGAKVSLYRGGVLVLQAFDPMGGFHPNFFNESMTHQDFKNWRSRFKADEIFDSPESKSNNHNSAFDRYLLEGTYLLRVENIGTVPLHIMAGKIRKGNGRDQVNEERVSVGESRDFTLSIFQGSYQDSEWDTFKINTNSYRY